MVAAEAGAVSIAQLLLDKNAKVNSPNDRNLTALHYATKHKHLDVVRLLLEFGATAFSNRNFQQKRLFNAPNWGPAAIRKVSNRPATAPTHKGYRQGLGESFSSASRVPPTALKVDDLGMMSRWSTEISGAVLMSASKGPAGFSGTVPRVLETHHTPAPRPHSAMPSVAPPSGSPTRPASAYPRVIQNTYGGGGGGRVQRPASAAVGGGGGGQRPGSAASAYSSGQRPASAAGSAYSVQSAAADIDYSADGIDMSHMSTGGRSARPLGRPSSAASMMSAVSDVVSRGDVTIMRKSAGGDDYQLAKLRLLGLA